MRSITKLALFLFLLNVFSISTYSSEDIDLSKQCFPETAKEIVVRAKYTSDDTDYLYIGGIFPGVSGEEYSTTLISTEDDTCEVLIAYNDFETKLYDVVSFEIEKELWIDNLEYAIYQAGGQEQLQSLLFQLANSDVTTERSTAEVQAMEELNLEVPPFYNLISNDPEIDLLIKNYQSSQEIPTPKFINNIRVSDSYSIADWYRKDGSNGLIVAAKEAENWEVIGHTSQQDGSPSPEQLNSEFGVPIDIASELLEAD